jgi:DNA-binding transcriptional MerR regulator
MKRRGNRRYYQHHEVLMIRRIRELLYEQGFTISGARNKLQELAQTERDEKRRRDDEDEVIDVIDLDAVIHEDDTVVVSATVAAPVIPTALVSELRRELLEIRELLRLAP